MKENMKNGLSSTQRLGANESKINLGYSKSKQMKIRTDGLATTNPMFVYDAAYMPCSVHTLWLSTKTSAQHKHYATIQYYVGCLSDDCTCVVGLQALPDSYIAHGFMAPSLDEVLEELSALSQKNLSQKNLSQKNLSQKNLSNATYAQIDDVDDDGTFEEERENAIEKVHQAFKFDYLAEYQM